MSKPLATILITRPLGQQKEITARCEKLGLQVVHLPCLTIEPLTNKRPHAELFKHCDAVLFTSKNAVIYAHMQWPLPWPGTRVHAIGPATTAALIAMGQPVELTPGPPFNSESYLHKLEALQPQRLLIIKGAGGRNLIASRLPRLGWTVQCLDVYQRRLPAICPKTVETLIRESPPDIISSTSNEALINLQALTRNHWQKMSKLPLIVNSERAATLAKSMGFEQPAMVASRAGDDGQLEQVKRWVRQRQNASQ